MALRRRWTFFLLGIFLTWNAATYLFFASRPPVRLDKENSAGDLDGRLNLLQKEIGEQVVVNERLLKELQRHKEGLLSAQKGDSPKPEQEEDPEDKNVDPDSVILPVLVIACNRITIRRNLDQLLKYRPSAERFPIIVSQDCGHGPTADVIRSYQGKITHIQQPDLSDIKLPFKERKFQGYFKISRHYKWALHQMFNVRDHTAVIIVEDDLDIAPDFFEYFAATFRILHIDPSLWCVSAWNDNGKSHMVADDPELLYRTDFFPGLGWMVKKKLWKELEPKWPKTFWDDWMRHPDQRKERSCIRPEVSRTTTFGKIGVSRGLFYEKHLKFMKLNDKPVPFTKKDLTYLKKDNYDEEYVKTVYGCPLLTVQEVLRGAEPEHKTVRVQYSTKEEFKSVAKQFGIMEDLKSGVPRAGYRGVVSFMRENRRIYFAPPATWNGYDRTWN